MRGASRVVTDRTGPVRHRRRTGDKPTRGAHLRARVLLAVLGAAIGVSVAGAGAAFGYWLTSSSNPAQAVADALPTGAAPGAAISGTTATITIPRQSTSGGSPITTYAVTRHNAYVNAPSGGISGPCSVSATTVSCTDTPGAGAWTYSDAPTYGTNWRGADSAQSNTVYRSSVAGLSPTAGVVGATAQLFAQGFLAGHGLTVTVGGAPVVVTSGGTSGSDGATTLWFVVPTAPGGPQTVTVSDGIHSASSGVPWTLRAGLAVSPSHGTSGTLSGTGFDAAEPVSATLAGGSLTLDPTNPTVQADGSWTATFTTTAPDGPAVIEATDGGGAGASTTFTVGATLSFATDQSITKLPATIVGGSAAGFGDAEQLAFHLDSAGGPLLASSPPTVTTDAAGSASDFSVTVPADTADGPHTVVAVGASSGVTATSETVSVEAASTFTIAANQQVSTSALPAQVTGGSVADFGSTEGLTIHLDTATGPLLGTTPSTLTTAGDGQAGGIDATIPSGTAAGSHVLVAVGGTSGQVATSNTFVVQPAITHVQDAAAGGTNVATVSPTLSSPPTSGDTLVLVVADDGVDGARVVSVSGGGVAAWTDVTSVIGSAAADPGAAEIWYGPVTCGPCGAGDRTVSVTMSQPTGIQLANVSEWAGISAANPVDATTGGSGSGSAFAAGPTPVGGSLLEPGELVVSAAWVQPGDALTASQDAATGFTLLDQAAGDQTAVRGAGAYLIDPSSAPVSADWQGSIVGDYATAIASFVP